MDELKGWIADIVSGATKHKEKLELTDEQMAAIAAFWAAGGQ